MHVEGVSEDAVALLRAHGIQPSAQRVAIAQHALFAREHLSADQVWNTVRQSFPMVSRATVYNTLNRFVDAGLMRPLELAGGRTVFDPRTDPHHHFIDDATGQIQDIDAEMLEVLGLDALEGIDVREVQVVVRGTRRRRKRGAKHS